MPIQLTLISTFSHGYSTRISTAWAEDKWATAHLDQVFLWQGTEIISQAEAPWVEYGDICFNEKGNLLRVAGQDYLIEGSQLIQGPLQPFSPTMGIDPAFDAEGQDFQWLQLHEVPNTHWLIGLSRYRPPRGRSNTQAYDGPSINWVLFDRGAGHVQQANQPDLTFPDLAVMAQNSKHAIILDETQAHCWDLETGKLNEVSLPDHHWVAATFVAHTSILLAVGRSGTLIELDVSKQEIRATYESVCTDVRSIALAHEQDILLLADEVGIHIFSYPEIGSTPIYSLSQNEQVQALSLAPTDQKLWVAGEAPHMSLYELIRP